MEVIEKKRAFNRRDWQFIADFVIEEWSRRKRAREDREKQWAEVDRQLRMEPEIAFKKMPDGRIDAKKAWMAEMELPLQAQALEVLTADARRLMFPDTGTWFRAHAEMTDDYLDEVDFSSIVLGDKAEVPSQIDQDNVDKLVEGFLLHTFRQYDIYTRMDRINTGAFKYGMGIGRACMETKNVYIHEARGVRKEKQKIPVIEPVCIKQLYLDDRKPTSHTSDVLGPAFIAEDWIRHEALQLAANKGSNDALDEHGGWMPNEVRRIVADDKGFVHLLEMEGDIVIPRKTTRSMVIPGAIVTVAIGGKSDGNVTNGVVRLRYRKSPYSSYLMFPYHFEDENDPYPTSPLMKGRTVQMMATDALNRLMDSAALKNAPPVGYSSDDMWFAQHGGPVIHPGAQWQTTDEVRVYDEIGGDPSALSGALSLALNLYAELTGILPARLGAQTVSHTTAFAKDAELQRGAVRTVDYVRQSGHGGLTKWLDMSYRMAREALGDEEISYWIDSYGGFVQIDKTYLPEKAVFEWFGSSGPAEEQAKMQARLSSLQLALQMDQLKIAMGGQPTVDIDAAIQQVLREGKWTDVDAITRVAGVSGGTASAPAVPDAAESGPGAAVAALQALAE